MSPKIVFLVPRSDMFPTLALDFLNGFKLATRDAEGTVNFSILVESVGLASEESMLKTCEKLILQEDIDMAVSFCGTNILPELVTIFNSYKKPLLRVDLGGVVMKEEYVKPYVAHLTLAIWQSVFVAAKFAAHTYGKKVAILSSTYEGGYHFCGPFVEGFVSQGGEVVSFNVSPMDYKTTNYEVMISEIKASQPDVIFAAFSYNEGKAIFNALANASFNGKIPIMTIPTMTDETINTENFKVNGVQSVASWSFADNTDVMRNFINNYEANYNEKPNVISLLGFETGRTTQAILDANGKIHPNLSEVLQDKKIETPRGIISFNNANEATIDYYKLREFQFENSEYKNKVIQKLNFLISEESLNTLKNMPNPGWHNPYICT